MNLKEWCGTAVLFFNKIFKNFLYVKETKSKNRFESLTFYHEVNKLYCEMQMSFKRSRHPQVILCSDMTLYYVNIRLIEYNILSIQT